MPLNAQGYELIDIPPVSQEILDSYDNCPVDDYMGHGTRFKRFSQYRLSSAADGGWTFDRLPHRDYTAFKKFNPIGGGIKRTYEPIEVDFTPLIAQGITRLGLDVGEDWQINVHQNRSSASDETNAPLTPEGVHHDGHEFVMIAVLRKQNVAGAQTRLWVDGADEPFWSGTLEPGQAVLLDDKAIAHDVTDVESADGGPAHRDILIVAFSRWKDKWYGEEHDKAVLEDVPAAAAM
ncbi:MAG TPA: 2OG-Fe dioxygenase family protein [Jatrophihabitans sp.]|nr:2OG-Fe dioxygenase family protein [Jatrophihabitans sp.]